MLFKSLFTVIGSLCRKFSTQQQGNIAVIAAISATVLVMATGVSVDLASAYSLKTRLQNAVDAAALAVGADSPNATSVSTQMQAVANSMMTANLPNGHGVTVTTPVIGISGQSVLVSASATVSTSFMAIAGVTSLTVTASGTALRSVSGLDLVLVLDNTASISSSNMTAIKNAAQALADTVYGSAKTNNAAVRVSVIPFTGAVNPGSYAHAMVFGSAAGLSGCVVERYSTFAKVTTGYSATATSGGTPVYSLVAADLDTAVTSVANTLQQWNGSGGCPGAVQPLTNSEAGVTSAISAMTNAGGSGTMGAIGVAWAYRVLSPSGPFGNGYCWSTAATACSNRAPYVHWKKVVVLMTDGIPEMTSAYNGFGNTNGSTTGACSTATYAANNNLTSGCKSADNQLINASSSLMLADMQESAVCDALRANGVTIYSIYFNDGTALPTSYVPAISYCAGTSIGNGTGSGNYYYASNVTTLQAHFTTIGNSLTNLRLSN
ncbi:MAG TPA: hypothetical protein HPQ04_14155 [Rhodospirillaceae bacterium]|nr:hypothetical protein [Rhodospirillaceae bacterium]